MAYEIRFAVEEEGTEMPLTIRAFSNIFICILFVVTYSCDVKTEHTCCFRLREGRGVFLCCEYSRRQSMKLRSILKLRCTQNELLLPYQNYSAMDCFI